MSPLKIGTGVWTTHFIVQNKAEEIKLHHQTVMKAFRKWENILFKNADIAVYKAKEKGKNQYVICSSELKDEVINKIKITNSLYRALERDEFRCTGTVLRYIKL